MRYLHRRLGRAWPCIAVSIAALAAEASADDLLIVDLTVTNQVTITATAGLSAVSASGSDGVGVYFENFYGVAGGALNEVLVSGDLTNAENPSGLSPNLFRGGGGADPGLNFFNWSSDSTVTFTAGALAFVGTATWTLEPDDYTDMLAGSASGNLYFPADDLNDLPQARVIGTYSVIPAPATLCLLAAGGLAAVRRRR